MTSAKAKVAVERLDVRELLTGKSALVRRTFTRISAHVDSAVAGTFSVGF